MSSVSDLQKRAEMIRQKYEQLNAKDSHTRWDGSDYAAGFVGDSDLEKAFDDSMDKLETRLAT